MRKQLNLPRLPYPLCFNVPRSSWAFGSGITLLDRTKDFGLFIDLVVEIRSEMKNVSGRQAEDGILGYRWCAGVSDRYFLHGVTAPTVRDRGVCFYYSRFPNGYNVIGETVSTDWNQVLQIQVSFAYNGSAVTAIDIRPEHGPAEVAAFLSSISTLNPGDLISLGFRLLPQKSSSRYWNGRDCSRRTPVADHHPFVRSLIESQLQERFLTTNPEKHTVNNEKRP